MLRKVAELSELGHPVHSTPRAATRNGRYWHLLSSAEIGFSLKCSMDACEPTTNFLGGGIPSYLTVRLASDAAAPGRAHWIAAA